MFRLSSPSAHSPVGVDLKDLEDPEDYVYLAMCGSSALDVKGCRFTIGGFGEADWNFDVGYDMSTLVEQLPETLARLRLREVAEVDLYSQGVERTLEFISQGEIVVIRCHSRTSWSPDPAEEIMSRGIAISMFEQLAIDFAVALDWAAPNIAELVPFRLWKNRMV